MKRQTRNQQTRNYHTGNRRGWDDAANILCVRLNNLGDVLMTTPAIRALKEALPGRRITLLTSSAGAAAARHIPEIDEVIEYPAPWMKSSSPRDAAIDFMIVCKLRKRRFDAAVIFTAFSQNPLPAALLCHMADVPLRLAHCRENPYHLLTDWAPELEPEQQIRHEVRRQLDLVATVGARATDERLAFAVDPADMAAAHQGLHDFGIDGGQPWVLIHPGASAPSRRYPAELWVHVIRELSTTLCCPIVLTGDGDEVALVDNIRAAAGAPTCSLAGQLDLGQLAALISLAPVLIANNTGPVHIAAALGTPVVDLYALTNPQHTPWLTPSRVLYHDVPCRFCYKSVCPEGHHECLRKITPAQVVVATAELLQEADLAIRPMLLSDVIPSRIAESAADANTWRPLQIVGGRSSGPNL